ncbi:MAG TPA: hypothetical protein VFZ65_04075, partial [Planctomycetota bacterium]|nr:hypothetical protein [Planctomycetota bacterium]
MSGDRDRDEVFERRLDWALREVAGGQKAPDVTARVLARHAAGDDGERVGLVVVPPRRSWLLAAVFLLGLGVVFGVFLFERAVQDRSAALPQEPVAMVAVSSLAEIEALPAGANAVELRNLDDAAVAVLARRCPDLGHLRVFASTQDPPVGFPSVSITDAAFAAIGSLSRLRSLELIEPYGVRGTQLAALEALPLLERLAISSVDLDEQCLQVLPRLPSLRELSLDSSSSLGEAAMSAVATCGGLSRLSLRHDSIWGTDALLLLRRLQSLTELDLTAMQLVTGRPDPSNRNRRARGAMLGDREKVVVDRATPTPPESGGLKVDSLGAWPRLQRITLAYSPDLPAAVGEHLRENCPNLREVDLSHCPLVDDTTVASLLGLRSLRRLNVGSCDKVSRFCVPLLAAAQQLREVDLSGEYWVTLEQAEQLLAGGKR